MTMHTSSLKLYTKIILSFLCAMHGSISLTSEEYLALHNKIACNFVQNFPSKTLAQAGKQYWELEPITRRMVWHKINSEQKLSHMYASLNLSEFLNLASSFSPIQQYKVLSGDSDVKGEMFPEAMPMPMREHILKMLATKTIEQLCKSKADINGIFGNQKTLLIKYNDGRVKESSLEATKAEFFGLTNAHMGAIRSMPDSYVMEPWSSKSELCLFNELPPSIQEKFKPCVGRSKKYSQPYYDIRIRFYYRDKITPELIAKSALYGIREYLPSMLTLLYAHYVLNPAWMDCAEDQDPGLLALNAQKEATNLMIPDDPGFIKYTIEPVPSEHFWRGGADFILAAPGTLLPFFLFSDKLNKDLHRSAKKASHSRDCKFQTLWCTAHKGFWSCMVKNLLYRGCKLFSWTVLGLIAAPIAAPFITRGSQLIFAFGVPKGLIVMGTAAILMGLKNGLGPQLGIIDFEKGGSVEKLLNNPNIELCEKKPYFYHYDKSQSTKPCM
jgi:hypothetical protein